MLLLSLDEVIGDGVRVDVAVKSQRFAAAGLQVVELVAADRNIVERGRGLSSVEGNAEGVGGATGSSHYNVMNVVVEELQIVASARDIDANRNDVFGSALVIADLESLNNQVTLVSESSTLVRFFGVADVSAPTRTAQREIQAT